MKAGLEYYSRENLQHLYFEEGITHIGSYAYYGSEHVLSDIHLPSTLESIGSAAFYENATLTSIEIPEGVSSIGNFAFSKSGLTEVTIPKAITTLSDSCFKDCASLKEVHTTQDCNLSFVYTTTFSGCPDDLTFFGYTGSYVESYANDSGYHFVAMDEEWTAEMILPTGIKVIEEEAFENGAFHSVEIPEGAQSIGNRVFAGCSNLERIIIPASVQTIAPDAFEGVDYLVVYCPADSYAQQYARNQGFLVVEK